MHHDIACQRVNKYSLTFERIVAMPLLNDNELAPIIDAVPARLQAAYVHSYMLWLLFSYLLVLSLLIHVVRICGK